VTATTLDLSAKHFASTSDARDEMKRAIDAIPDADLQSLKAFHVFLMK
jgi:hypothetical protein